MIAHSWDVNKNRKTRTALTALPLVIVVVIGVMRVHREFPAEWSSVIPQQANSESKQIDLQRALKNASDEEGPKSGIQLPLARFVQTGGSVTTVYLVQGQFYAEAIEPHNVWRQLGRNVLLVSSVDQDRSDIGPSSGPIAHGCSVSLSDIQLQLGQASIIPCSGSYESGGHVKWVGVVTPVIWAAESSEVHPCWRRYGITSDAGYQACISNAVTDSLQDLFTQMRNNRFRDVDAVVIPAIGTGVGGLSKASFYQTLLASILVDELKRGHRLPQTIVLQVPRGDTPNTWPETESAISTALAKSVAVWAFQTEHKNSDSEWLSLIGVAIGGSLVLTLDLLDISVPLLADSVEVFTKGNGPLILLMWTSTAVGLVSMFKSLISLFPAELNLFVQIGAGFLAALFCGSLLRANRTVEDTLKQSRKTSTIEEGGGEV